MDSSPFEQEVNVVNTFLQVTEVNSKAKFRRSQTAPVADLAPEDVQNETGSAEAEKSEKVIEEFPEEIPVKKLLRTLPTLNRIETPEPWDLAALAESLKEEEEEHQAELEAPARPKVMARPGLIHSATPDMWEWEAMVRQESPPVATPPVATVTPAPAVVAPNPPAPSAAPSVVPTQGVFQAAAQPVVSLLPVPVTFAVPSPVLTPPMSPSLSPSNGFVGLLGSCSPGHASPLGSLSPKESDSFSTMRPGTLETSTEGSKEVVRWCVDGTRFDSHQERILSPEFQLHFPGQAEPFSFRMVILATQTGGKHGAGFRKAKGRGSIELKCQSTVPANVPSCSFNISMGVQGRPSHQVAAQRIFHNFVDKTCCPLRNGDSVDWDFKHSVAGKGCEISVEVDFQK